MLAIIILEPEYSVVALMKTATAWVGDKESRK
jgi:hypothetical protein